MIEENGAKFVWIGGYTTVTESGNIELNWVTGEPVVYEDWLGPYEPTGVDTDGTPEDCVMIWYVEKYGGWGWNDSRGDLLAYNTYRGNLYFICEFEGD